MKLIRRFVDDYTHTITEYDMVFKFKELDHKFSVNMRFMPEMQRKDIVNRLRKLADVIESPEKHNN